jgi:hypothetical protein
VSTKKVTMSSEHYYAVRRVLRLLDGYLQEMPDALHGFGGGMMTTKELHGHVNAALGLMPIKRRQSKSRV